MTTTTSFSDRGRFWSLTKENLRRNIGTMAYTFVLTFFFFPVQYLLEIFGRDVHAFSPEFSYTRLSLIGPAQIHTGLSVVMMTAVLLVAPMAAAVGQMSYMHNRRSVDLYHSLPVSRTQLMLSGGLCAFLTTALPMALNYLIILVGGAVRAALPAGGDFPFYPGQILLDALGWAVTALVIIAAVLLVAAQVGSVFETFAFSGVLLAAPLLVVVISMGFCDQYLLGYANTLSAQQMSRLTPLGLMIHRYTIPAGALPGSADARTLGMSNLMMLAWLAVGAVFLWMALWLYGRRKSEMAESSAMVGPIGVAAKAVIVFSGASAVGALFSAIRGGGKAALVFWATLGAALTFLLLEAVLNRGFKGIKRTLPAGGAMVAGVLCLALVLVTGGLGYENRIPAPDNIREVTVDSRGRFSYIKVLDAASPQGSYATVDDWGSPVVSYRYGTVDEVTLTDPEAIQVVRQIHQATIDRFRAGGGVDVLSPQTPGSIGEFSYGLANGRLLRRYNGWIVSEPVGDLLWQLEAREDFVRQSCPLFFIDPHQYRSVTAADRLGLTTSGPGTGPLDIARLVEALQADILAQDLETVRSGSARVLGYVYFDTGLDPQARYGGIDHPLEENAVCSFSIRIYEGYMKTRAVLKDMGLDGPLIPAAPTPAVREIWLDDYRSDEDSGYFRPVPPWDFETDTSGRTKVADAQQVEQLLSLGQELSGGRVSDSSFIYLTPVGEDGAVGVQLVLPAADAPDYVLEKFPYLKDSAITPARTKEAYAQMAAR